MGLSYVAFACSIEQLQSLYSSRDEALFERIVFSRDRGVRHYLDMKEKEHQRGRDLPENLLPLADLFIGASLTRYEPHEYAYSLCGCLYVLGTEIGESGGGYGRQQEAQNALEDLGEREDLLPEMTVEWPIPGMPPLEDWPMYCGLPAPEVERRAAAMTAVMKRIAPVYKDAMPERATYFLDDITRFYEECAAMKSDLVLVCH